ncbi:MAG: PstS family phosphate ABC transporter substrate-binding protein [Actinobacteria bacterium]|nr:MAG: PstS family phosphate ABC transporter substrate-binding protein [Actinomycetota bacterium]
MHLTRPLQNFRLFYISATTHGAPLPTIVVSGKRCRNTVSTTRRGITNVKKLVAFGLIAALALGALGLTGCGRTADSGSGTTGTDAGGELTGTINVEGSDTLVNMATAWSQAFMTANPGVMISVKGGGSGTGIASLINKTIDFANASREMKQEEIDQAKANGVNPVEYTVARDGIAVVVNPANGVEDLTLEQIGKIYRGEITNWSEVGGADKAIVILSRDSSSGTYEYFKEAVVGKDKNYASSAKLLPSNQAIVDETAANDAAIGYVGVGYVDAKVKVLKVEGVAASVETVLDDTYKISRGLYMYSDGEATGVMKAYLDWILGAEGQKLVQDEGFVPVQ